MTTSEQVCAVIERETAQTVDESTRLDSLEVDSLEFVNLLLEVGNETGKEVPPEKWGDLHTVADIVRELDAA
jgi:acyl carrier protein